MENSILYASDKGTMQIFPLEPTGGYDISVLLSTVEGDSRKVSPDEDDEQRS